MHFCEKCSEPRFTVLSSPGERNDSTLRTPTVPLVSNDLAEVPSIKDASASRRPACLSDPRVWRDETLGVWQSLHAGQHAGLRTSRTSRSMGSSRPIEARALPLTNGTSV
jgi:hypothetical protein